MPEDTHNETIEGDTEDSVEISVKTDIVFEKKCLYCGQPNSSLNYICSHHQKEWRKEYRSLDIQPLFSPAYRQKALTSFHSYSLNHPDGIIQYSALPFRDNYPQALDPVGMTPLHHLKNLSIHHLPQVYIKNEGHNPSGCFKDRETLLALLNTLHLGLRHAVIYSSGNAAASAAIFAQKLGMQLITFVAGDTYPEKIDFIREHGSDVVVVGDENTNFETGFRLFAKVNAENVFSSNKFDNWSVRNPYRVQGDKTTAVEIVKQLSGESATSVVPDFVIVPTANGSCLAGIWKGFKELKQLGAISWLPKMVSAGIAHANPVYQAVQKKQTVSPEFCDLSKVDPEDANIGSTILAEEGYDSIEAAKAVLSSKGLAVEVNNNDIKTALRQFLQTESEMALEHAILPEPASLVSIAAIEKIKEQVPLNPSDKVVSLITGHGMKAREVLEQLLPAQLDLQELAGNIIDKKKDNITPVAAKKGRRRNVAADFMAVVKAFHDLKKYP